MATLDKQHAQSVLDPILAKLEECISGAWEDWRDFYAPNHHILDSRARAAIVYCHIVDRAMSLFQNIPGVVAGRNRGIFRLFVGEDIALRFKKAKKNGTTSNVSTKQQRLIDLQLVIPGLLPGAMVNAVYQIDDLQRDISNMMVTHQLDRRIVWSINLKTPPSEPTQMTTPSSPVAPASPQRARVKGHSSAKKAVNQGS